MKVLKIGADNCPGCVIMKPRWQEIEQEYPWLKTEYIEGPDNKEIVKKYNIDDFPVFIFLDKQGKEINRFNGVVAKKDLIETILKHKDK